MADSFKRLLRRGALDSAFQIAATSGVRLLLVACVPLLAMVLPAEQIARFDLFLVGSSIFIIAVTWGLDSGLALAATARAGLRGASLFWVAVVLCLLVIPLAYLPLRAVVLHWASQDLFRDGDFERTYAYGAANGLVALIFAYFRWIGRSLVASALIVLANLVGLAAALAWFAVEGSVAGFMNGLVIGALLGALLGLGHSARLVPVPPALWRRRYALTVAWRLARASWPFGLSSLALISRRVVDRYLLLLVGTTALLGHFAVISRMAELLAFALTAPAMGFVPLVIREYRSEAGRRVARLLYNGYLVATVVCMVVAWAAVTFSPQWLFPPRLAQVSPLFLSVLGGTLLFSQSTVAGFGFVIANRTHVVGALSLGFIAVYAGIAWLMIGQGQALQAVGVGYVVAGFIFATAFVGLSESLCPMSYRLGWVGLANAFTVLLALAGVYGV